MPRWPPGPPPRPQPQPAQRQLDVVVDHQHVLGLDLVPLGQTASRVAAAVHVGLGHRQKQPVGRADQGRALHPVDRDAQPPGQLAHHPEAQVVARFAVALARIPQAENQPPRRRRRVRHARDRRVGRAAGGPPAAASRPAPPTPPPPPRPRPMTSGSSRPASISSSASASASASASSTSAATRLWATATIDPRRVVLERRRPWAAPDRWPRGGRRSTAR